MDQDPDDEREARIVADMEIPPELCGVEAPHGTYAGGSCVYLKGHEPTAPTAPGVYRHSWEVGRG